MESLFLKLVNLSITAVWLILAVIVLRLIFRKAPKWIFCVLWGLVALRLIIPVSFESRFSLIPSAETLSVDMLDSDTLRFHTGIAFINSLNPKKDDGSKIPGEIYGQRIQDTDANLSDTYDASAGTAFLSGTNDVNSDKTVGSAKTVRERIKLFSIIWIAGMIIMMCYALISYILLKIRLRTAVCENNTGKRRIFRSEHIPDPFVLGIIRPCIYLPFALSDEDKVYVLTHEESHIKRGDHIWKFIGFVLLSIYWFNPFLWIAYIMLCNDIECACDEKVIATLGENERQPYSVALLNSGMSVTKRHIIACPVAFGEVSVKTRIKNVMNYKKPAFWIVIVAAAVCIVLTVCFLTNPVKKVNSVENNQIFDPAQFSNEELSDLSISQNVYDLIAEDWKRTETMDEFQLLASSHMFGFCYKNFETWDEMSEFTGVSIINPLEKGSWPKKNDIGQDSKTQYNMDCYGWQNGTLRALNMSATYNFSHGFVEFRTHVVQEDPYSVFPVDQIGDRYKFTFKNIDDKNDIMLTASVMICHYNDYDSVEIAIPDDYECKYSFNIVSHKGTGKLKEMVDEVCAAVGLSLTYDTILKAETINDSIPGTDTEYGTDYFINFNPDSNDTEDKIDINRR